MNVTATVVLKKYCGKLSNQLGIMNKSLSTLSLNQPMVTLSLLL